MEHRFRARGRDAIARCHCAPWRRCVQERFLFSRCFCILCCSGYLNKNYKRFTPKGPQGKAEGNSLLICCVFTPE